MQRQRTGRQKRLYATPSLETSSSMKEMFYPSPAMRSEAPTVTKTRLVNCASAEDVPDHIGGSGSQVSPEESDRETT